MEEKGTLSIHTENIFPIIKKFLYSDHEVFLRELVSNAVDATQKIKQLASIGDYKGELGELKVKVEVNKEAKTITISDRGIGMSADEIKKYINQIAFSGATEFIDKYKDKADNQQIIGHFGLGFYSSFMVAERVEIQTKSYQEDAEAARWNCDGSTAFEITKTVKKERGTDIILHIAEDSLEFLENHKLQGILDKYCKFLPVEVEFDGKVINKTAPIWTIAPSELKDQDYLDFYKELHPFAEEPLFWIHLNVDYPFNLTGILYFPKVKQDFEIKKNKIQLYSRQVFITDEVKDIVPEFLMLLHGVIDSPDIPLNVSRSFLQADGNVKKISSYITRKVADKLVELFKNDRKAFEEKWENIGLFVKYGLISEDKFYEKANSIALLKNTKNEYFTFEEYKAKVEAVQKDKDDNIIYLYTTDSAKQHAFIQAAQDRAYDVLLLDGPIDSHFINMLEQKLEKTNLKRVDAEVVDKLIDKGEVKESVLGDKEQDRLKEVFETATPKDTVIQLEALAPEDMPVLVTLPEFMRRMQDMAASNGGFGGMMGQMPNQTQVTVNTNHPLMTKILNAKKDNRGKLAKQAYDLALLSQNMLVGEELTNFVKRSVELAVS